MSKYYLHLTGGLGNQLFQLAAALSRSKNQDVVIISDKNGRPRSNKLNEPDLYAFSLPDRVMTQVDFRYSKLASKASGYVIRMTANPRRIENNKAIRRLILFTSSCINSIYFKHPVSIFEVEGIGYTDLRKRKNLLIGYFQSFRYLDQIPSYDFLDQIELKHPSVAVSNLIDLAKKENPIIMHVRRGDYKNEKAFGLIGDNYYHESLKLLVKDQEMPNLWVFSDDIEEAKSIFNKYPKECLRYIDNVDDSPAHSLEVMRYGSGYVIGNSSFSWWAAALRKDRNAPVIAPKPWFKFAQEPNSLIPPQWQRVNGHHFSSIAVELENEFKEKL